LPATVRVGTIGYVAVRILIVDDDSGFVGLAAELLTERGFEIFAKATDAAQALDVAAGGCPDGILLDVNLPGPDGFATATALAAVCPSATIVLTSAATGRVAPEILRNCHVAAFVPKEELALVDLAGLFRLSAL